MTTPILLGSVVDMSQCPHGISRETQVGLDSSQCSHGISQCPTRFFEGEGVCWDPKGLRGPLTHKMEKWKMKSAQIDYFWTEVNWITTDKGIFPMGSRDVIGEIGEDVSFFTVTDNGVELITAKLLKVVPLMKQVTREATHGRH